MAPFGGNGLLQILGLLLLFLIIRAEDKAGTHGADCDDATNKCNTGLKCVNKKCECEVDKYFKEGKCEVKCPVACSASQMCFGFPTTGFKCVEKPDGFGDDCSTAKCKTGLTCLANMCICSIGQTIENKQCVNIGPVGLFKKCAKNDECPNDLQCYGMCSCKYGTIPKGGKCVIDQTMADKCSPKCNAEEICTEHEGKHVCFQMPEGFHTSCTEDKDCKSGLTCFPNEDKNNVCQCKHNMIIKGECKKLNIPESKENATYGEECSTKAEGRKCHYGLKCTAGKDSKETCMCMSADMYWNGRECKNKLENGVKCDWVDYEKKVCPDFDSRCKSGACRFGVCDCSDRSKYLNSAKTCVDRKKLKDDCKESRECIQNAVCKEDSSKATKCDCDMDSMEMADGTCKKKYGYMDQGNCKEDKECITNKCADVDGKKTCVCESSTYWNRRKQMCENKMDEGGKCWNDKQCKSNNCIRKKSISFCGCSNHVTHYFDPEKKSCEKRKSKGEECDMDEKCILGAVCTARFRTQDKKRICQCTLNTYFSVDQCKELPIRNVCPPRTRDDGQNAIMLTGEGLLKSMCGDEDMELAEDVSDLSYDVSFGPTFARSSVGEQKFKPLMPDSVDATKAAKIAVGTKSKGDKIPLDSATKLVAKAPYCGRGVLQIKFYWKEKNVDVEGSVFRVASYPCDNKGKDVKLRIDKTGETKEPIVVDPKNEDIKHVFDQIGKDTKIIVEPAAADKGLPENTADEPHVVNVWFRKAMKGEDCEKKVPARTTDDLLVWASPDHKAISSAVEYPATNFHFIPYGRKLCGEVEMVIQFDPEFMDEDDDKCNNLKIYKAKIDCKYEDAKQCSIANYPMRGGHAQIATLQDKDDFKSFIYNTGDNSWRKVDDDGDRRMPAVHHIMNKYTELFSEDSERDFACDMALEQAGQFYDDSDFVDDLHDDVKSALHVFASFSGDMLDKDKLAPLVTDPKQAGFYAGIMALDANKCLFKPSADPDVANGFLKKYIKEMLKESIGTIKRLPKLEQGETKESIMYHASYFNTFVALKKMLDPESMYGVLGKFVENVKAELSDPSPAVATCDNWRSFMLNTLDNSLDCDREIEFPETRREQCNKVMRSFMMSNSDRWGGDSGAKSDAKACGKIRTPPPIFVEEKDGKLFSYTVDLCMTKMCARPIAVCSCDGASGDKQCSKD